MSKRGRPPVILTAEEALKQVEDRKARRRARYAERIQDPEYRNARNTYMRAYLAEYRKPETPEE